MKKPIFLVLIATFVLASCSTILPQNESEPMPGGQSVLPSRYIQVGDITDLDNEHYEIIGVVSGTGKVDADNPENGDTHKYGKFVLDETSTGFENITMAGTNPYDVSLGNAIYQLITEAKAKGAQFVIYPSYTVEFTNNREIITNVTAIAVKVIPD